MGKPHRAGGQLYGCLSQGERWGRVSDDSVQHTCSGVLGEFPWPQPLRVPPCSPTVLMPLLEYCSVRPDATVATHHFFGPDAEIRYRLEVPGAWGATTWVSAWGHCSVSAGRA